MTRRRALAPLVVDPMPAPTLQCSCCGSFDWIACSPGSEAEPREQGKVINLRPAPGIPAMVWCWEHWPARTAEAALS